MNVDTGCPTPFHSLHRGRILAACLVVQVLNLPRRSTILPSGSAFIGSIEQKTGSATRISSFMSYFRLLKCDIASEAWRRTFSSLSPNMATENEIEQGRSPPVTALSKRRSKDRAISVSFGSNLLNGATFCCFDHFLLRLMLERD